MSALRYVNDSTDGRKYYRDKKKKKQQLDICNGNVVRQK